MKYKVMLSAAAAVLLSANAYAYDVRLDITGELTASTCTIDGPRDKAVVLPTLSTNSLSYPGAYAGRTPVTLTVTGCTGGETTAEVYFEPGDTNITNAGNLANLATTGPANNVEVQLLNAGDLSNPINLNTDKPVYTIADDGGEINLVAQYFSAPGGATAGAVSTFIEMSMLYQ